MQLQNNLTLVFLKVEQGSQQKVTSLIEQNPEMINLENPKSGQTLLCVACRRNDYAMVQLLIENGADVSVPNKFGQTPLWISAFYNFSQISQLLLEMNADYNIQDKKGWSPLMIAAKKGHNQIVQQLLEAGANYDLRNKQGENVFDLSKDYETLQQMIQILGLQAVKVKYPIKFRHKRTQSSDQQFNNITKQEETIEKGPPKQSDMPTKPIQQKSTQQKNTKFYYEDMILSVFTIMERQVLEQLDNLKNYLLTMSRNQKDLYESLREYENFSLKPERMAKENRLENVIRNLERESCKLFIRTCENWSEIDCEEKSVVQREPFKSVQNLTNISEEESIKLNRSNENIVYGSLDLRLKELCQMVDGTINRSYPTGS